MTIPAQAVTIAENLLQWIEARPAARRTVAAQQVLRRIDPNLHAQIRTLARTGVQRGATPRSAIKAAIAARLTELAQRGFRLGVSGLGKNGTEGSSGSTLDQVGEVVDQIGQVVNMGREFYENVIDPLIDDFTSDNAETRQAAEEQAKTVGIDPSQIQAIRGGVSVVSTVYRRAVPSGTDYGFDLSSIGTTAWLMLGGGALLVAHLLTRPKKRQPTPPSR